MVVIQLWSINKSAQHLERLSYFAPIVFVVLLVIADSLLSGKTSPATIWVSIKFFGILGIGIGYLYVLTVNLGYYIIYKRKSEPEA